MQDKAAFDAATSGLSFTNEAFEGFPDQSSVKSVDAGPFTVGGSLFPFFIRDSIFCRSGKCPSYLSKSVTLSFDNPVYAVSFFLGSGDGRGSRILVDGTDVGAITTPHDGSAFVGVYDFATPFSTLRLPGHLWNFDVDDVSFAAAHEGGDAGSTAGTAQDATGFETINGTLIDLGNTGDIDMFKIFIDSPDEFGVTINAGLSFNNDTEIFLFDDALDLVLSDDDGGAGLLSEFEVGSLSGAPIGEYFLGLTTWSAIALDGGNIFVNPLPSQTGPYSLNLSGVGEPIDVHLPGSIWLVGIGLVALGFGVYRHHGAGRALVVEVN
jgi:hypothetical protein